MTNARARAEFPNINDYKSFGFAENKVINAIEALECDHIINYVIGAHENGRFFCMVILSGETTHFMHYFIHKNIGVRCI